MKSKYHSGFILWEQRIEGLVEWYYHLYCCRFNRLSWYLMSWYFIHWYLCFWQEVGMKILRLIHLYSSHWFSIGVLLYLLLYLIFHDLSCSSIAFHLDPSCSMENFRYPSFYYFCRREFTIPQLMSFMDLFVFYLDFSKILNSFLDRGVGISCSHYFSS